MTMKNRKSRFAKVLGSLFFLGAFLFISVNGLYAGEYDKFLTEETKDAEFVGTETCASCHEKENREFELSSHARFVTSEETDGVAQGCETCHGPGSVHVDNGGGKGTMINPDKKPEVCFTCHSDKQLQFKLPYRHPVLEGKMSCSDCHNVHGSDKLPWTTTSLDGTNGVCFNCHKEQRGPFVYEHEALREGCTNCHDIHGSIHDKMLIVRDNNLCFRCHSQSNMGGPFIGDRDHSGSLSEGTCYSGGCHTAVHGSNFNDHLRY